MPGLTFERASELLHTTTTEPHLFEHALGVSAAMGAMARHFGADEAYWKAVTEPVKASPKLCFPVWAS